MNSHNYEARKTFDSLNALICVLDNLLKTCTVASPGDQMDPYLNLVFTYSILSYSSVLYYKISSDFSYPQLVCQSGIMKLSWMCQPQLTRSNSLCICCIPLGNLEGFCFSCTVLKSKSFLCTYACWKKRCLHPYFHSYFGLNHVTYKAVRVFHFD